MNSLFGLAGDFLCVCSPVKALRPGDTWMLSYSRFLSSKVDGSGSLAPLWLRHPISLALILCHLQPKRVHITSPMMGQQPVASQFFFFFFNGQLAIELKAVVTNKGGEHF